MIAKTHVKHHFKTLNRPILWLLEACNAALQRTCGIQVLVGCACDFYGTIVGKGSLFQLLEVFSIWRWHTCFMKRFYCNLFSNRMLELGHSWGVCQFYDCHLPSAPMVITPILREFFDESQCCKVEFLARLVAQVFWTFLHAIISDPQLQICLVQLETGQEDYSSTPNTHRSVELKRRLSQEVLECEDSMNI